MKQSLKIIRKRWRDNHPEYYELHKKEIADYLKKWRDNNREHILESVRDWQRRHPDRIRLYSYRRKARKRNTYIEDVDKNLVWMRDDGICQIKLSNRCWFWLPSNPEIWHLDHIIPLSLGGLHSYENVQASCPPCNLEKHTNVTSVV